MTVKGKRDNGVGEDDQESSEGVREPRSDWQDGYDRPTRFITQRFAQPALSRRIACLCLVLLLLLLGIFLAQSNTWSCRQ